MDTNIRYGSDNLDSLTVHIHKDHLGNIVSVWDATNDTTVQRTFYYASGMPMSESRGRSKQPNLYNGKEYEQVHGYDVYDFGARGYYAAVARFTSIDPLAENTPWQSPYSYASNNFIAEIDWMGLGCLSNMLSVPQYSWAAINSEGNVVGWGNDENDNGVYLVDDLWDGTYEDLSSYLKIGYELGNQNSYIYNTPIYYMLTYPVYPIDFGGGNIYPYMGETLMYGRSPALLTFNIPYNIILDVASIIFEPNKNNLYVKTLSRLLTVGQISYYVYNLVTSEEKDAQDIIGVVNSILSTRGTAGVAFVIYYDLSMIFFEKVFIPTYNELNDYMSDFQTWGDWYMNGMP